jgi:hypothetical protein
MELSICPRSASIRELELLVFSDEAVDVISNDLPDLTFIITSPWLGKSNVLKLKLLGAIGVSKNASKPGWAIGPPDERE